MPKPAAKFTKCVTHDWVDERECPRCAFGPFQVGDRVRILKCVFPCSLRVGVDLHGAHEGVITWIGYVDRVAVPARGVMPITPGAKVEVPTARTGDKIVYAKLVERIP